ncbi:MAG: serine hydrolase [Sediminibacterium sp.]|nr:serine hydrolase [Sediminibacterium sp.]MBX9780576.1 class A beta-lactamase-related serine hydrolase [Chitinophagaceae bacterium]
MKKSFPFFILLLLGVPCFAQKKNKKLTSEINALVTGFNGNVGIYVHDLKSNKTVTINADTIYPTASMVKVPILVGVMDKIKRGELDYHQTLIYTDSLFYDDGDVVGNLKNNAKIELSKVIMLMLTTSDNTASLWLQSLAGKGTRINELMDSIGLKDTRVNSRTPGRENNRAQYGWGQTTPREMAKLMEMIVTKKLLSDSLSEKMIRVLGRNYWDEQAISQVPANVFVASKNGAVNASRSEVLYVKGNGKEYIFCICTKDNFDKSWGNDNEAWILAMKLSKLLWERL